MGYTTPKKSPVRKRFTEEGREELRKFRKKNPGNAASLGKGKKSPQALRDALAAAGGPSPLPKHLIDRARRGDFAK